MARRERKDEGGREKEKKDGLKDKEIEKEGVGAERQRE